MIVWLLVATVSALVIWLCVFYVEINVNCDFTTVCVFTEYDRMFYRIYMHILHVWYIVFYLLVVVISTILNARVVKSTSWPIGQGQLFVLVQCGIYS